MQVTPFLPTGGFVGFEIAGALGATWCDELRAALERRGFAPTGAAYPGDYRDNDRLVFDDAALAARLFERVGAVLPAGLMVDGVGWRLHGLNPRFRACRYRDGQAFCIHRDGPFQPDESTRSLLTLQLYLDDASAMVGGRTRFYADRGGRRRWASISPRLGAAIVFDHQAWHDGEAVTAGCKHVLRTDVVYRRPRAAEGEVDPRVIGRHLGYAWGAVACPGGDVASCGRDGVVRRWRGGAQVAAHDLAAGSVTALAPDRRGRLWCGTRSGVLAVIDGDRLAVVSEGLGAVLGAAALPGGGVVVGTSGGEVLAFDEGGPPRRVHAHDGWAWGVAADGGVVSCGSDGRVLRDGRQIAALGQPARAVAALRGGELLVGTADGAVHRLRGDDRARWQAHEGAVTCLASSPGEGDAWASGSEDGTVALWRGDRLVGRLPPRRDFVTSVAFTPGGALLSAGYDGAIRVDDLPPG